MYVHCIHKGVNGKSREEWGSTVYQNTLQGPSIEKKLQIIDLPAGLVVMFHLNPSYTVEQKHLYLQLSLLRCSAVSVWYEFSIW
jgi:hypothetical protein